ncbi:hypothetical protein NXS19_002141 [Fusarium pseudograminearum]|nr:hypothetical protein NXS19_002141 [Fusarium pseudograminearum]
MTSTAMISNLTLEDLPAELLLKIFRTMPFKSAARLVRTNKALYTALIQELYRRTRDQGWFPMGFACATGNTSTISKCLSAGAHVDIHIPRDVGTHHWADANYYVVGGWRPLREAMSRLHVLQCSEIAATQWGRPRRNRRGGIPPDHNSPLAYAYRRGAESRRNVVTAKAICVLLVLAGADLRVLDPVKQLEVQIMTRVDHYIPASWR